MHWSGGLYIEDAEYDDEDQTYSRSLGMICIRPSEAAARASAAMLPQLTHHYGFRTGSMTSWDQLQGEGGGGGGGGGMQKAMRNGPVPGCSEFAGDDLHSTIRGPRHERPPPCSRS